jgi:hypothetical protein
MKTKNIPRNLSLYSKIALLWHTNSEPFLSGDLFADNADVNVYPYIFRGIQASKREVARAGVVFCRSDYLERFLDEYRGNINARVLILGNSDRDFADFEFSLPKSIRQIFVQNLLFRDKKLSVLPIGLENRRLATNGDLSFFKKCSPFIHKDNRVLIGPISQTHIERSPLEGRFLNVNNSIDFLKDRLDPDRYHQIANRYRYISAPRGNGMDTHRFWESLYLGSIPIVKYSLWAEQVAETGVPIFKISDWTLENLMNVCKKNSYIPAHPSDIPTLWWKHWREKIQSYC